MNLPTLTQAAKGTASFSEYCQGILWYVLSYDDGITGHSLSEFRFPIPIEDSGDGAFTPLMKGIHVLRWVRKHAEYLEKLLAEAAEKKLEGGG